MKEKLQASPQEWKWLQNAIQGVDFFAHLSIEQMDRIFQRVQFCKYSKGEQLIKQGDPGDALYIIYQGMVGIQKKSDSGTQEVAQMGSGGIFGEIALLHGVPRVAGAVTLEESKIFIITAEDFKILIEKNKDLADKLRSLAAERQNS